MIALWLTLHIGAVLIPNAQIMRLKERKGREEAFPKNPSAQDDPLQKIEWKL